jgi:2-polyprenyl-6-methoxyphenol hydroxylase-like FAD-dependent oxidoreductase
MNAASSADVAEYDVIVVGAGPSGLTAAIDLGHRGVRCLVLESRLDPAPWPKADRANARTMEAWRRLGSADRIRAGGYPADNPMDVFVVTRLCEAPLASLRYPSVQVWRERISVTNDGSVPLEPYQLVSQNAIEPILRAVAEATTNVELRYGWEVVSVDQHNCLVHAQARDTNGTVHNVTGRYLVGADGGHSIVRRSLGLSLNGWSGDRELVQVVFDSETLYENIVAGPGRHYMFIDGSVLIAQGNRRQFTLHTTLPPDSDFATELRKLIGVDLDLEVQHILTWRHRLAITDSYGDRRVFIVGDAAHLVIPSGGLGMNTAVGDSLNLSWKLAAVIKGWGGPGLLSSYHAERHPVGEHNVQASGWAADGIREWRQVVDAGTASPLEIAQSARELLHRMHSMVGAELGYLYSRSPIIALEPAAPTTWDTSVYRPSAQPGARLPHMWLSTGEAAQDIAGTDFTLLNLNDNQQNGSKVEVAFAELGVPLKVLCVDEPQLRHRYGASLILLRPDLHVAWRGDADPADSAALAALVTGW